MQMFRSALYVSAEAEAAKIAKRPAPPDIAIVDLEEAVEPSRKTHARERVAGNVAELRGTVRQVGVRINGTGSEWAKGDLDLVRSLPTDVRLVLPKPITSELLRELQAASADRAIWIMAEEADFATNVSGFVSAGARIERAILGIKDLAEAIGEAPFAGSQKLALARRQVIGSCLQGGIPIIDGVAFGNPDDVRQAAQKAREDGCEGISLLRWGDAATVGEALAQSVQQENVQ